MSLVEIVRDVCFGAEKMVKAEKEKLEEILRKETRCIQRCIRSEMMDG